jgi:hypothetical protein
VSRTALVSRRVSRGERARGTGEPENPHHARAREKKLDEKPSVLVGASWWSVLLLDRERNKRKIIGVFYLGLRRRGREMERSTRHDRGGTKWQPVLLVGARAGRAGFQHSTPGRRPPNFFSTSFSACVCGKDSFRASDNCSCRLVAGYSHPR